MNREEELKAKLDYVRSLSFYQSSNDEIKTFLELVCFASDEQLRQVKAMLKEDQEGGNEHGKTKEE